MKKVLALVLAVVLAFGMTTVAFAADPKAGKMTDLTLGRIGTFDEKTFKDLSGQDLSANETYYIEVDGSVYTKTLTKEYLDSGNAKSLSALSEYKVRTSLSLGGAYISAKPTFVIKEKKPYVMFKTADKFNLEDVDYEMEIKVFSDDDKNYMPDYDNAKCETNYAGTISYGDATTANNDYTMIKGPITNFDDVDSDTELEFADDITFKVNGKDQKELFLRMSDSDDALDAKYPDADLKIVKFEGNNKTFRRTGTLTIPADMVENKDGKLVAPVLYNYEGGKLTVNKEAKYNEEISAFEIKTNKLGNYVITPSELKATATEPGTEEPAAPGTEPNPDTGANDFVGLAVALAVVSVAGIAVAKRK